MNLHNPVASNMEYIQRVFLSVQTYMQKHYELEDLIAYIENEPPRFRSVAYEAASLELAQEDLSSGKELINWINFYHRFAKPHKFHMDIGLGWAFAKTDNSPCPYFESLPVMSWMVFDGIGYYYGLFKGRRTVKDGLMPEGITGKALKGFDQGLGRRLWYISKGEVSKLIKLIQSIHTSRHADLWRGVGIACGYVGGSNTSNLGQLLNCSTVYREQLRTGIALAAISRSASDSVTSDLDMACNIICGMKLKDVLNNESLLRDNLTIY